MPARSFNIDLYVFKVCLYVLCLTTFSGNSSEALQDSLKRSWSGIPSEDSVLQVLSLRPILGEDKPRNEIQITMKYVLSEIFDICTRRGLS